MNEGGRHVSSTGEHTYIRQGAHRRESNIAALANGLLGKNGPCQMPVVGDCGSFLILSEP